MHTLSAHIIFERLGFAANRDPLFGSALPLSSHLKILPKPESLRHLKILPETPAPRAAVFPLASPLADLVIVAPEPTVCAGFLTVGPAEADEGREALGLKVHPRHGVLARGW